jgi:hypothetical protein
MRVKMTIFFLLFGLVSMSSWWLGQNSGAATSRDVSAQPASQSASIFVPTTDAPLAATPISTLSGDGSESSGPPIWMTLSLLGFCCVLSLIFGVFILGFVVRAQNMKAMRNERLNEK